LKSLNELRIVETSYTKAKRIVPTINTSTVQVTQSTDTDLLEFQGYLKPASQGGIDAFYAWDFIGGHGEGVKIIDFEHTGFFLDNVDLPSADSLIYNQVPADLISPTGAHAASVLGIMSGKDETQDGNDAFGIKGIAHNADYGIVITGGKPVAQPPGNPPQPFEEPHITLKYAFEALSPGDILLIEFAYQGRIYTGDTTCPINGIVPGLGQLPLEYDDLVYDVIEMYTASPFNIVVIEGAANSNINLDDPRYNGVFSKDSGAIIVGARESTQNNRSCFSNYGDIIKVHAWGDSIVTTTTSGDVFPNDRINLGGDDKLYNTVFGGTSGATPIVAGAAAVIQSILAENGLPKLNSKDMRLLLSSTGTPQLNPSEGNIGSMPDLKAAIDYLLPPIIPPTPDAYENDDDTLSNNNVIGINNSQQHNFADDSTDWIRLSANEFAPEFQANNGYCDNFSCGIKLSNVSNVDLCLQFFGTGNIFVNQPPSQIMCGLTNGTYTDSSIGSNLVGPNQGPFPAGCPVNYINRTHIKITDNDNSPDNNKSYDVKFACTFDSLIDDSPDIYENDDDLNVTSNEISINGNSQHHNFFDDAADVIKLPNINTIASNMGITLNSNCDNLSCKMEVSNENEDLCLQPYFIDPFGPILPIVSCSSNPINGLGSELINSQSCSVPPAVFVGTVDQLSGVNKGYDIKLVCNSN
jgi:hypothetical protein